MGRGRCQCQVWEGWCAIEVKVFPYHGVWGRGGKHHTLEPGRTPQEGWCGVQGCHYRGCWNANCGPLDTSLDLSKTKSE